MSNNIEKFVTDLAHLMQQDRRPSHWDNIFFLEAVLWSRMSHDAQTKCGCVLVKNKSTISTGYNGFMRDISDFAFPTVRPYKYPFMIHAEANAIYNAAREGKSTIGATAYITAPPCTQCLQMLWQCGISEICFTDLSSPKLCFYGEEYKQVLEEIHSRMKCRYVPKKNLSNELLIESVKIFENIEKDT